MNGAFYFKLLLVGFSLATFLRPLSGFSQEKKEGSLNYLQQCNGFNDLRLGADIKQIPKADLKFMDGDNTMDADSCLKYEYKGANLNLDDNLDLDMVGIRTYKNKIVNIYVFFKKEDGDKVLENFLANYGNCTDKPQDFVYDWNAANLSLSLRYKLDTDLGIAVFTNNKLQSEIESGKTKLAYEKSQLPGRTF